MVNSAVVLPDKVPTIRTELVPKLNATKDASVDFKEARCLAPPKSWTVSVGLVRAREVTTAEVALLDLDAITQTFADVHTVSHFEEGDL